MKDILTIRFPKRAALIAASTILLLGGFAQNRRSELATRTREVDRAWAELQAALQARSDLVPRLLEGARDSRVVPLLTVLQLGRARDAADAARPALLIPSDVAVYVSAQAHLSDVLRQFVAQAQRDTELRRDSTFAGMLAEVVEAERRIAWHTQRYNQAAIWRNELLKGVPAQVSSRLFQAEASPFVPMTRGGR